jgi:hypothetical protein
VAAVDLDGDGDLDVLTHDDTLDDAVVKPHHGIQWLENRGTFPFVEHTLAKCLASAGPQAVDLDGDFDIVACALLASGADIDESTLPALIWLEQTKPGVFERHTLEKGATRHASLDGDVGTSWVRSCSSPGRRRPRTGVEVWENQRVH